MTEDTASYTEGANRPRGDVTRLCYLTDAAVAISLTLLFLPTVATVNRYPLDDWSTILTERNADLTWVITTFIVLVICWRYHHVLFEYLRDYDRLIIWLNFFWLFCIVSLPVLTLANLPSPAERPPLAGPVDFALRVLMVRGDDGYNVQNFVVYWMVLALSFLALFAIAKRAKKKQSQITKAGDDYRLASRVYLRPFLVCLEAGILGGFFYDYSHWFLWGGILIAAVIAIADERRNGASQEVA